MRKMPTTMTMPGRRRRPRDEEDVDNDDGGLLPHHRHHHSPPPLLATHHSSTKTTRRRRLDDHEMRTSDEEALKKEQARPRAYRKKKSIHKAEEIRICELTPSSLLGAFPRRQRSKRSLKKKNESAVQTSDLCEVIMEKHTSQPLLVVHRRARRKRKSRKEVEMASDSEVVSPRSFRSRGSSKRRINTDNVFTQQQGKLDTNIFQCYLENLWRSFSEEKKKSFAFFDCLWYSLYTKEASKAKVLNWIKRKHIFSTKYVFVPIVRWCHWSLLILCHFGDSPQSKTGSPCMLLLDSLQMTNPKRLEPGIRKFVSDIYGTEERSETKDLIKRIPLLVPKVPQQRNGDECGSFVLYYINLFLESAPEIFSISEGYPYFMKEDWFTLQGLECFIKHLDTFLPLNCTGSD